MPRFGSSFASMLGSLARLPMFRFRVFRFGLVGASGTVVNMVVLYLCQEHLLRFIANSAARLNLSLAIAILCATINNFSWNRGWTWADRGGVSSAARLVQFGQYASACWVGIALQFGITKLLAAHLYYLIANLVAILIASAFNYLLNDLWTFGGIRLWWRRRSAAKEGRDDRHDDGRDDARRAGPAGERRP